MENSIPTTEYVNIFNLIHFGDYNRTFVLKTQQKYKHKGFLLQPKSVFETLIIIFDCY